MMVLFAAITCRRRKGAARDIKPSIRTFLADRKAKSVGMDSGSMVEDPKQEQNVKDKVQNEEKPVEEKKTQASEQQLLDVAQEMYQMQQKRLAETQGIEQDGGDYENFGPSKKPDTPERSAHLIVTARPTLASNSTKEKNSAKNSTKKDTSARLPTDATQDMSIVEKSKMYKIRRGEVAI
ncbi:unnamed protein product [Cylicostephanus goldi]|uniref:Uncharacterized protein n=1 Tax=Cylicostephanus goldi TaxID=71465 RepID=A0A3P6RIG0_CYLGO|nr:unnamed protein product [Cylicostephanus goldi]